MYRDVQRQGLSRAQFDAARLGFFQTLRRKRMSPQFLERHGEDLFAQACFEYSRRVSEGVDIADPPAWIITCGWNRTKGLLETRDWRPRLVSAESIAEPADEEDATPEGEFLAADRRRKVREAVDELPAYQRRLLALSYFEGESIREAARRLRWTASKAQRAHEAAQRRIHQILAVESTDDIQIEIGLFAFLSMAGEHASGHALPAGFEILLDSAHRSAAELGDRATRLAHLPAEVRAADPGHLMEGLTLGASGKARSARGPLRRVVDLGRRLINGGAAEAGAAASGEGAGRMLEVCKGLAICAVGGGALTGAALIGGGHHLERPVAHRAPTAQAVRHQGRVAGADQVPVSGGVVPSAPAPRRSAEVHSTERTTTERETTAKDTPRVETAGPAAGTEAAQREARETNLEEEFRDFDATEGTGAESSGPTTGDSLADAATTGASSAAPGKASPTRRAEEAGAAKEFHGLLE